MHLYGLNIANVERGVRCPHLTPVQIQQLSGGTPDSTVDC